MSAQLCKTANRWFLLFMTSLAVIMASVKENAAVVVKRDTTLDNVKAMYNRFVNPSTGKAKYVKDGKNACSLDLPPSVASTPGMLHVAASKDDFQSSLGCGVCLQVTGNGKPAAADLDGAPPVKGTLNAIVIDQDDTLSQGDLALLPPESGSGLWEIHFKAVDCPTGLGATGFIQLRFTGSNEMYFKLQAMNAKVPVAGIEAFQRVNSKWFCLTKTPDNYFSSEGMAAVSFPLMVRLTSIMNEQLEATIEALKNDVVIVSDIQFSNTDVRGGTPEGIKCYGQGNRPPSDEGDEAFCVSKEDGIYADQEDETAFYVCEGEKTTKKFCPTGLKFNPTISSCDVPEDVPFVGNEAGLPGKFQSKVITRWTSLPGNAGLKVLSVGGPEEHDKHLDETVLNTQKPHKIFSINIFNGAHATAKTAADNGNVQKDKEQRNLQNNKTAETRVSQVNTKARQSPVAETNFQDDLQNGTNLTTGENSAMSLQNGTNLTTGENSAMSVSDNTDLAISDNSKPSNDNLQNSLPMQSSLNLLSQAHRGKEAQLNSSQLFFPSHLSVSSTLSESAMNSGKNLQNVQETGPTSSLTGKTSSLKGHRGFSPHKEVFAINLFRLQPKAPTMHNRYENTTLSGDQVDPAHQFKDEPILSNKVSVHPLYAQMNDGEVSNNPGTKFEHEYQEQNLGDSSVSKLLQNNLPTTGEATARPLHLKLKIHVDKSGKHPGINCTLSECPEQQNGLVMGSSVHPNYNNDLQEKKNDSEFRITLNTVGSDPLKDALHLIPNQASDFQRLPSQINVVKYPSNLQGTHVQLLNQTREQFPQHINGNTTLKVSAVSQEENDLEVQDNGSGETAETMKGEQVDKQSEHENDTNTHLQNASTDNRSAQDNGGFIVARLPLSRKYESYVKNPAVQIAAYNDSKLENTRLLPMKANVESFERAHENISDQTQNNNISANGRFTKLQTTLHQDTLTSALPDNTIKNKLHGKEQLDKENFLQAQTQPPGNRPQLKIILKNPGKLGTFINHITELKKRSGARGHIVQILKSLIDKPLNVGLINKDVVSKLSNLMKKSIRGKTPQSDNDLESIKDSGSIAQSILEANKEYLDDVAMQGIIFSDGDLETENMTDIADSIKQSHTYQQQTLETPQWENTTGAEEDELQDPSPDQGVVKQAWYNDEHLMNQDLDDGDDSSSASGMGDSNSTASVNSSKAAKSHRFDDHKEVSSVIVGQADGASEVNAYRGGMLKSKLDPKLKSFCIGKRSGIYTNPFDQKSFVICSNGLPEERECPSSMLFNSKEKICDIPDKMYTENSK